jgi:hypothetical protein
MKQMVEKSEIDAELVAVGNRISEARAALARNEILEIRDIPERMREVASAITDLAPEDATEMRPPLMQLLADFKTFAEELRSKIEEIETANRAAGSAAASGQSGR